MYIRKVFIYNIIHIQYNTYTYKDSIHKNRCDFFIHLYEVMVSGGVAALLCSMFKSREKMKVTRRILFKVGHVVFFFVFII